MPISTVPSLNHHLKLRKEEVSNPLLALLSLSLSSSPSFHPFALYQSNSRFTSSQFPNTGIDYDFPKPSLPLLRRSSLLAPRPRLYYFRRQHRLRNHHSEKRC
ncbi:hypothetical protein Ancab_023161 [Ancistrocladus abbreviatus]